MINDPHLLTVENFAPHVGAAFRVDATPAPVDLRLDGVSRSPPSGLGRSDPFLLVFSTPFAVLLVSGAYRMRAPDGQILAIDLNPTQTPPGPRRAYHAVFA